MNRAGWERVICIASGPSFDLAQARRAARAQRDDGWRIIVVNDTWRLVPLVELRADPDAWKWWAPDALYACDGKWWRYYFDDVARYFAGERWTQVRDGIAKDKQEAERFGLFYVRSVPGCGLAREQGTIRRGGNSGHQLVELVATEFGTREIVLIAYDMQNTGGRSHFHGHHPKPLTQAENPSVWIPGFDQLARDLAAAGVRVINASADTALRCFERSSLDEALGSVMSEVLE